MERSRHPYRRGGSARRQTSDRLRTWTGNEREFIRGNSRSEDCRTRGVGIDGCSALCGQFGLRLPVTIRCRSCTDDQRAHARSATTIVEGPLGSEHVLGSLDVPEGLRGTVCNVGITRSTKASAREPTLSSSNTESLTLRNVESATNPGVHIDGQLTLGDQVTLSVVLGAYLDHGAFSGGATVVVTRGSRFDLW